MVGVETAAKGGVIGAPPVRRWERPVGQCRRCGASDGGTFREKGEKVRISVAALNGNGRGGGSPPESGRRWRRGHSRRI